MYVVGISLIVVAVVMIGLSWLIMNGEKTAANKAFAVFILSCGLWSLGIFTFTLTDSISVGLIASDFNYVIALCIAASFFLFSLAFPYKRRLGRYKASLAYIPAIIILIGTALYPHLVLTDVYMSSPAVKLAALNMPVYMTYAICFVIYVSLAYINLFRSYLSAKDSYIKTQIGYIIIGTLVPYLIATYFDLILPIWTYAYVWAGPLMGFIVMYVIIYAVYKHHLLHAEVLTAELLTASLWIFVGVRTVLSSDATELTTNIALLAVSIIIGVFLIRSFRRETASRKQLADLNQHLEEKVAEQTADMRRAYELERKARAELEELNEKKDIFITQTQHNLRTPLTSIKWALETLRSGRSGHDDDETKKAIEEAEAASKNMSEVVEDFIDITGKR